MKISGWKIDYPKEFQVEKFVIIAAPHTSNWDLYYALAIFWVHDIPVKFFIKDSFTKGLHGYIFKALGAIGVDRKRTGNLVHHAASVVKEETPKAEEAPVATEETVNEEAPATTEATPAEVKTEA